MSGLDDEFGIPICPIPWGNWYLWIDREEWLWFLHGLYFGNRGWVKQNTEYSTETDWVYVSADYKSWDVLTFIYDGFSYILQACRSRKSSPEGRKYNIQISRAAVTPGNMILPWVQRNRVYFEELDNTEYANRELMEKIFAFFKQHGLEARWIIDMTTPTETQLLWE